MLPKRKLLSHERSDRKGRPPALSSLKKIKRRGHPSRIPCGAVGAPLTGPGRAALKIPYTRKAQAAIGTPDPTIMDRDSRNQYLREVREEYVLAAKKVKTKLLDEAVKRT